TGAAGFGRTPPATSPHRSPGVVLSRHAVSCTGAKPLRPAPSRYHLGYPLAGSTAPTAARPEACWADTRPAVSAMHAITASRIAAAFVLSREFIFSSSSWISPAAPRLKWSHFVRDVRDSSLKSIFIFQVFALENLT